MLQKIKTIEHIEIVKNVIQVRESTQVIENGITIGSPSFHRWCLNPGDDISDQDERVQAIANAIWTHEVIAAYQQSIVINEVTE